MSQFVSSHDVDVESSHDVDVESSHDVDVESSHDVDKVRIARDEGGKYMVTPKGLHLRKVCTLHATQFGKIKLYKSKAIEREGKKEEGNQTTTNTNTSHTTQTTTTTAPKEILSKTWLRPALERKFVASFGENGGESVRLEVQVKKEIRILEKCSSARHSSRSRAGGSKHVVQLLEIVDDLDYKRLFVLLEYVPQCSVWHPRAMMYVARTTAAGVPSVHDTSTGAGGYSIDDYDEDEEKEETDEEEARRVIALCKAARRVPGGCKVFCIDTALEIARQAYEAVTYLHSLHIVHNDVKPDNMGSTHMIPDAYMVDYDFKDSPTHDAHTSAPTGFPPDLCIKLFDFSSATEGLKVYGAGMTTTFMPPEAFSAPSGVPTGPGRDLWSVGIVLFVSMFGLLPYVDEHGIPLQEFDMQVKIVTKEWAIPKEGEARYKGKIDVTSTDGGCSLHWQVLEALLHENVDARVWPKKKEKKGEENNTVSGHENGAPEGKK